METAVPHKAPCVEAGAGGVGSRAGTGCRWWRHGASQGANTGEKCLSWDKKGPWELRGPARSPPVPHQPLLPLQPDAAAWCKVSLLPSPAPSPMFIISPLTHLCRAELQPRPIDYMKKFGASRRTAATCPQGRAGSAQTKEMSRKLASPRSSGWAEEAGKALGARRGEGWGTWRRGPRGLC